LTYLIAGEAIRPETSASFHQPLCVSHSPVSEPFLWCLSSYWLISLCFC